MAYVWINPVAASMYEEKVLDEFLYHHGYEQLFTSIDWLTTVREKYRKAAEESEHTVVDVRCPKICELLEGISLASEITVPEIEPILIHCGQEVGHRVELKNAKKVITTPCQALADMGNALEIDDTQFVTWNHFLKMLGDEPKRKDLQKSPIPPGFFDQLGMKTVSVTGEEEIRNYLENHLTKDVKLVELLFCKEGCHNGDGIRRD